MALAHTYHYSSPSATDVRQDLHFLHTHAREQSLYSFTIKYYSAISPSPPLTLRLIYQAKQSKSRYSRGMFTLNDLRLCIFKAAVKLFRTMDRALKPGQPLPAGPFQHHGQLLMFKVDEAFQGRYYLVQVVQPVGT